MAGFFIMLIVVIVLAPVALLIFGLATFWQWATTIAVTSSPGLNGIFVSVAIIGTLYIIMWAVVNGANESSGSGSFWQTNLIGKFFRIVIGIIWGAIHAGFVAFVGLVVIFVSSMILLILARALQAISLEFLAFSVVGSLLNGVIALSSFVPVWGALGTIVLILTKSIKALGTADLFTRILGVLFWILLGALPPIIGNIAVGIFDVNYTACTLTDLFGSGECTFEHFLLAVVGGLVLGVFVWPLMVTHNKSS